VPPPPKNPPGRPAEQAGEGPAEDPPKRILPFVNENAKILSEIWAVGLLTVGGFFGGLYFFLKILMKAEMSEVKVEMADIKASLRILDSSVESLDKKVDARLDSLDRKVDSLLVRKRFIFF